MSFIAIKESAQRAVVRATLGARVRAKAARADNLEKIAELVSLRAQRADPLQPEDFIAAGRVWDVPPRVIHAIADAESSGSGFEQGGDTPGRVIPTVECHAFSCATLNAFDVSHPHLSYPNYIRYEKGGPPPKGMRRHPLELSYDDRWGLFAMQAELDVEAACCAVSLNRFQQLIGRTPMMKKQGIREHWRSLGFSSAESLFRVLCVSEMEALDILRRFLVANGLMRACRDLDWRAIARGYNGPANVDVYSVRMADAYKKRGRFYA